MRASFVFCAPPSQKRSAGDFASACFSQQIPEADPEDAGKGRKQDDIGAGELPLPFGNSLRGHTEEFAKRPLAHGVLPSVGTNGGRYAKRVHSHTPFSEFKFGFVGERENEGLRP